MTLILAIIPVLLLIILMAFFKMPGDKSSIISLVVTMLIALFGFTFSVDNLFYSFLYGALKAVSPILIIILMAIFSYNVLLKTEKMEIIKQQFASISTDKSIQVLLLTWGFGGLLEAMAGFGTAVAIPAAILISLGFKPIFSATVSLIANSVATAFGAIGTPVLVLAKETNLDVLNLSISPHVPYSVCIAFPYRPQTEITPQESVLGFIGRQCFFNQPIPRSQIYGSGISGYHRKHPVYHRHRPLWQTDCIQRRKGTEKLVEDERYSECMEYLSAYSRPYYSYKPTIPGIAPYIGK